MKLKELRLVGTHLVTATKSGINCTKKTPNEKPMIVIATQTSQTLLEVKKMRADATQPLAYRVARSKVTRISSNPSLKPLASNFVRLYCQLKKNGASLIL